MCRYFCIGFINFMIKGKSFIDFTILFFPNNFRDNDKVIVNYFLNQNQYEND